LRYRLCTKVLAVNRQQIFPRGIDPNVTDLKAIEISAVRSERADIPVREQLPNARAMSLLASVDPLRPVIMSLAERAIAKKLSIGDVEQGRYAGNVSTGFAMTSGRDTI
jgi:hypothetical protein